MTRPNLRRLAVAATLAFSAALPAAAQTKVEVIHWWTSGSEAAAIKAIADAYRATGGVWVDTSVAISEQARAVAVNRIVGGNPPAVAQFNTTKQFHDLVEEGLLAPIDDVAVKEGWDKFLPELVLNSIRVKGRYYAAPVNIHSTSWFWFSLPALKKAGVAEVPTTFDDLFVALDKLKAAGLIPLAHGGQTWQDAMMFTTTLSNVGGKELYLKVLRDRDPKTILGEDLKKVLLAYKRLQSYTDRGAPGRNWNDATALLIAGKAGVQAMGDWAKGEFLLAKQVPGKDYACRAGITGKGAYVVQGDVLVFPKNKDAAVSKAQQQIASIALNPTVQVAFSAKKGSVPVRPDVDASKLDPCGQEGVAILRDKTRLVGNPEMYLSPDENGAMVDVLTNYWNRNIPVEKVQKDLLNALAKR